MDVDNNIRQFHMLPLQAEAFSIFKCQAAYCTGSRLQGVSIYCDRDLQTVIV